MVNRSPQGIPLDTHMGSLGKRWEKTQMTTVEHPSLLDQVDRLRLDASSRIAAAQKAEMGQFLTPAPVRSSHGLDAVV